MRSRHLGIGFAFLVMLFAHSGGARADAQADIRGFIASISPPGAKISFSGLEETGGAIRVRNVVAQGQTADGGEVIETIGMLELHGLRPLERGLYHADRLQAENIRLDGVDDMQPGGGGVKIARISASGINGARIGEVRFSGAEISAAREDGNYVLEIGQGELRNLDAKPFSQGAGGPHALLNAVLNEPVYSGLQLRELALRKEGRRLLAIATLVSEADGGYAPFPASGKLSITGGRLDLRAAPKAAELGQILGQEVLQFTLSSRHDFRAPASHQWDMRLEVSPDGALQGRCAADHLSAFHPSLTSQAMAAGGSAALRSCDLNFTGAEFVNRWLAQDGAKEGLNADQARAKYLAAALYIPFDPQAGTDPLATEFSKAMTIFLSQPSRLNLRLDPPGGLTPVEAIASFAILRHGAPAQKQQAMQKLGLRLSAEPLN